MTVNYQLTNFFLFSPLIYMRRFLITCCFPFFVKTKFSVQKNICTTNCYNFKCTSNQLTILLNNVRMKFNDCESYLKKYHYRYICTDKSYSSAVGGIAPPLFPLAWKALLMNVLILILLGVFLFLEFMYSTEIMNA